MEVLPLSLLAFAAGVYLLIKVKKEYLSSLFSVLAWFVIVASLVSIVCSSVECYRECCGAMCGGKRECRMEKKVIINDGKGGGCHQMNGGGCSMEGCKMEGDSCVLDKAVCEKMMGKEACDAMCKERGRCIMSKDECMEMCHSKGGCMRQNEKGMISDKPGCCMGKGEEKKECCKKKTE